MAQVRGQLPHLSLSLHSDIARCKIVKVYLIEINRMELHLQVNSFNPNYQLKSIKVLCCPSLPGNTPVHRKRQAHIYGENEEEHTGTSIK
jgi:hypothetical protein